MTKGTHLGLGAKASSISVALEQPVPGAWTLALAPCAVGERWPQPGPLARLSSRRQLKAGLANLTPLGGGTGASDMFPLVWLRV